MGSVLLGKQLEYLCLEDIYNAPQKKEFEVEEALLRRMNWLSTLNFIANINR